MRDQFNLSGDFRGALLNIHSSLEGANQRVQPDPVALSDLAVTLNEVLELLRAQLRAVEPEQREAAQEFVAATAGVVDAAASAKPDRTLVQAAAQKVLEGGKALVKASPLTASTVKTIVEIVEKVVTFLGK